MKYSVFSGEEPADPRLCPLQGGIFLAPAADGQSAFEPVIIDTTPRASGRDQISKMRLHDIMTRGRIKQSRSAWPI